MSHKFHPTYLKSTDELKILKDAALALLERPEGRHVTYLEQQAYRQFEKLTLQLSTLFRLLPGTDCFCDSEVQLWDFSSAAVLGRQILEDCLTFLYLIESRLLVEEIEFRWTVWKHHGDKESVDIVELFGFLSAPHGPQDSAIPILKRQAEQRIPITKEKISKDPSFIACTKTYNERSRTERRDLSCIRMLSYRVPV